MSEHSHEWRARDHSDYYCRDHCAPGRRHNQCECSCNHATGLPMTMMQPSSFDDSGPDQGRCTCDPGPEGQHRWYCAIEARDVAGGAA